MDGPEHRLAVHLHFRRLRVWRHDGAGVAANIRMRRGCCRRRSAPARTRIPRSSPCAPCAPCGLSCTAPRSSRSSRGRNVGTACRRSSLWALSATRSSPHHAQRAARGASREHGPCSAPPVGAADLGDVRGVSGDWRLRLECGDVRPAPPAPVRRLRRCVGRPAFTICSVYCIALMTPAPRCIADHHHPVGGSARPAPHDDRPLPRR